MAASTFSSEPTFRLADRLATARRERFVGREAELDLFRSALLAAEPPFATLHLYGPGGIGKTTLLREYARIAAESGYSVALLDHNLEPSPPGFLLALRRALGLEEGRADLTLINWPPHLILLIDSFETLTPLDAWLRETLLPQLPGHSLVVIAERNPPAPAWRTDIDWAGLTRILPLRNLRPEESRTYLTRRGIPAGYHQLNQRLTTYLYAQFRQARGVEQQRIWFDLLYLARRNPFFKSYFDWSTFHSAWAEPASGDDTAAILEMVQAHEGGTSAQIARYWLDRQPQAFQVYRTVEGELIGFMAHLTLAEVTPADMAADPAVPAALNFVRQYGPLRPGEEILYLRFWLGRDTYQSSSPALNLAAINSTIDWMTRPQLAWNFIPTADPAFHQPHFASINMRRSPEADFEVGGRRYSLFSHDWRVEPVSAWLRMKAERDPQPDLTLDQVEADLPRPLLVLSQPEFEAAVRQALRDYTRSDLLAANPLMRSRLVIKAAEPSAPAVTLQSLLSEASATLTGNPKDEKLYRAIYHTYLEPAPTQEQAAERLDLPFNTYRYHLAGGIRRIAEWLWQRELHDSEL